MPRYAFGPYMPDLASFQNPGLLTAKGCVPEGIGYGPFGSLSSLTAYGALTKYARGSIAAVDYGGNAWNFAGDENALYKLDSGGTWTDVSIAAGYNLSNVDGRWSMAQFDNAIFAASYSDPMQYFDMQNSTLFAMVTDDQTAPRANHIAVVGDFLVAGDIYTQTRGVLHHGIQWSAQRNPYSWPAPGTDAAVAVQSDLRTLKGEYGRVMAVASGAELAAVVQETGIHRMDYVGGATIFELNDVQAVRGALVPGLAIPYGREILFLAEDGWYLFDYTTAVPIGEEVLNRTFLADLDSSYFHRVSWATHPSRPLTFIGYPGSGNTAGTPNKILVYNWALRRFSHMDVDHEHICCFLAPGAHIDSTPSDTLDDGTLGPQSFDVRQSQSGAAQLGAFDTSHQSATFTGTDQAVTLETGDMEINPGFLTLVNEVRPVVDGTDLAAVEVAPTLKRSDSVTYKPKRQQDPDGKCPARANGRYHRFRLTIPAASGFTEAVGIDVEGVIQGRR